MKKKIALIELTTYHEECLFSQIKFLKDANYDVSLIINPKNSNNITFYGIDKNKIKLFDPRGASTLIIRIINWFSLYRYIVDNKFEKVVFNTASSNKETIALIQFLPKSITCFGTIHNLKKLNHSSSQKSVSKRIKNYFVLNDFLVNSAQINNKGLSLFPYYPIYFPEYETVRTIDKNNDVWVCIPGELNYKRRDYNLVLKALSKIEKDTNNLKIILLGKVNPANADAKSFLHELEKLSLNQMVLTFDSFIENELFHSYIKKSDYIMAPVTTEERHYLNYKITGAYNLAFAYKKPLICPKEVSIIPDLKENSYFYTNSESLLMLFKSITNKTIENKDFYSHEKWNYESQLKNYMTLIEI
ncbi:hypothetical protein ACOCEA_15275 [Maribacter sp. CXY002]|uniref:hypothetical protein n=1 Tax=Maribacter luteocoastalis TaxID=3407671 RepID=UPI003B67985C